MHPLKFLFDNYMNECEYVRRLRPATLRASIYAFTQFTEVMPEVISVGDLSPETITVFFKRLHTRERFIGKKNKVSGIKDSTLLFYASRLKTFFRWLVSRQYLPSNPLDGMKLPTPVFSDHRALSGDQIRRIMGAVAQQARTRFLLKRDMAMVSVLTFCGLRRNELVSLEVRDVDLQSGYITVRAQTSKSRRLRRVPINVYLRFHLQEYLEARKIKGFRTQYLFVSHTSDRGLTLHGLKHWVERIVRRSGVRFHLHRFRHTFATNLAMQDVGAVKIQKLMGHAGLQMTQTYLRSVSTEEMGEDINKLSFENLA